MKIMSVSRMRLHFLLLILLCCVSLSSYVTTSYTFVNPVVDLVACLPHQIQALNEFKNEFDTSHSNDSDPFNGVWCDNSTGVITKLRLRSCLSGPLKPNSSLFRLHHLRYLDLNQNNFISSSLPSEFGNLNKLEVLVLSNNGFVGQVPSSFNSLSMLSYLKLSQNELTGSFPLVQNLTKLVVLDLSYNHFSGTIVFPNSPSSSRLEIMFIDNNRFEGQIIESISKLINLKALDLSFLNTSYPIDLKLFSTLKSLSYLFLSGNGISPGSLGSDSDIPPNLEILLLSGCRISEFPNILKSLQNLDYLDLSDNRIKGKVPQWLWNLPSLNSVELSNNSFNGFEGPAEVLVNSSVKYLNLELNCFEGAIPILPLSINAFSATDNRFTGIPLSICNCKSLMHLELSSNNLSGPIPQCLSNLRVVDLRKNNLEGSIPDVFNAGASLERLDVGYNQLTWKIPRSLVNCSSLRFLSFGNNKIEDTFPFWLKVLPNLQVLILRSNKFFGPISPPDQGPLGFPELQIFEISDNNFIGSLPPSYFENWKASNEDGGLYMTCINNTRKLRYTCTYTMELRYKGLTTHQTYVLTSYATIDFSGNKLEGQIPESIGLLKTLFALNLSNNAFTGHIPLSLANLTALESLDLSRNQLSGTIPNGLGSLSFLAYINVSHNQLNGEIPQGTQITGQPKSSFEGNAGLCGLPLQETCFGTNVPHTQQSKEEDEDDDDEEADQFLNWKGAVIGYGPGVLLGLAIAQVIVSYKPQWLAKIIGPNKHRNS